MCLSKSLASMCLFDGLHVGYPLGRACVASCDIQHIRNSQSSRGNPCARALRDRGPLCRSALYYQTYIAPLLARIPVCEGTWRSDSYRCWLKDFVFKGGWLGSSGFSRKPFPPHRSYLVDPASSHMLVSKIKPCKSKYMLNSWDCRWLIKTVIVYLMVPLLIG